MSSSLNSRGEKGFINKGMETIMKKIALAAVALAIVASRTVDQPRLVVVYLVAGGMHFAAAVAASLRWSRTPEFDRAL